MREFNKIRVSKTPQKARDFLWLKNTEENKYKLMMPSGSVFTEITLDSIADAIQFMGIAHPWTNPGSPELPKFYIAYEAGDYDDFDGQSVDAGEVAIFIWEDQSWEKYPIVQPPLLIGLDYDRNKGGLDAPYEISEDDWNDAFDAFMSGRGVRFVFTSAVQTYYANLLSVSKDAYMVCELINDDDEIKTILIQQEI